MAEQHGLRRLTSADVLVAAVTCLLLILLVPVLFAKPREQSVRKVCAANLAQIGKAMFLYAGDNEGDLPRAGGPSTVWGTTPNWTAPHRRMAFNMRADGTGGTASINASLYLLVKYYRVSPRVFVCKGDRGTTELKLSELTGLLAEFRVERRLGLRPAFGIIQALQLCVSHSLREVPAEHVAGPEHGRGGGSKPMDQQPGGQGRGLSINFKPDVPYPGGTPGTVPKPQWQFGHAPAGWPERSVPRWPSHVRKASLLRVDKDNIYTSSTDSSGRGDPYGRPWQPVHCARQPQGLSPRPRSGHLRRHAAVNLVGRQGCDRML